MLHILYARTLFKGTINFMKFSRIALILWFAAITPLHGAEIDDIPENYNFNTFTLSFNDQLGVGKPIFIKSGGFSGVTAESYDLAEVTTPHPLDGKFEFIDCRPSGCFGKAQYSVYLTNRPGSVTDSILYITIERPERGDCISKSPLKMYRLPKSKEIAPTCVYIQDNDPGDKKTAWLKINPWAGDTYQVLLVIDKVK